MVVKLLKEIEYNTGQFPKEILQKVIAHRDEIIPELLSILEYTCNNAEQLAEQENYFAHIYAFYILAQFREQSAYPLICNLLNKPYVILDSLLGYVITEGLPTILASVYDGDVELLKKIIENKQINEYIRSSALYSLVVMVAQGIITRDEVVTYFKSLFKEKLEREHSNVWNALVSCSCDIYPEEVFEDIKSAYKDELIDPFYVSIKDIQMQIRNNKENVLEELHNNKTYQLINDTIHELEGWSCFNDAYEKIDWNRIAKLNFELENRVKEIKEIIREPIIQEALGNQFKVGRNDPCPCGSGKKYKKCCG